MGFFKLKSDPISQRARELSSRIAELESRIKQLSDKALLADAPRPQPAPAARGHEPVFEPVDRKPLKDTPEPPSTPRHYNDLGARKFDLMAALERFQRLFRGPPPTNPKLVTYLAAGNIHGMRPLRYEKRVARNRFVALTIVLAVVLFVMFCFLARRR